MDRNTGISGFVGQRGHHGVPPRAGELSIVLWVGSIQQTMDIVLANVPVRHYDANAELLSLDQLGLLSKRQDQCRRIVIESCTILIVVVVVVESVCILDVKVFLC